MHDYSDAEIDFKGERNLADFSGRDGSREPRDVLIFQVRGEGLSELESDVAKICFNRAFGAL